MLEAFEQRRKLLDTHTPGLKLPRTLVLVTDWWQWDLQQQEKMYQYMDRLEETDLENIGII